MSESVATLHGQIGTTMEPSPFGVSSKKLTMWLFIASDAVTFGSVLFGYAYLRVGSPDWPRPFQFSPSILNAMGMTAVLLTSSLTMLFAVSAAKAGDKSKSWKWLGATILLGTVFATMHLREWFHMFHDGWSLSHNPIGGPVAFGATFFSITGLHLLHVISGIIALAVVGWSFRSGKLSANHVETTGLYWHFVDLVWMFVFPLLYLMNAAQ